MKIVAVKPFIVHVPLPGRIADSVNSISHWGFVGVALHTDDGLAGYGFTGTHAYLPGDQQIAAYIRAVYAPLLLGSTVHDPDSIGALWRELHDRPPLLWIGRAGLSQLALAAVDIALWDLVAKKREQPLWRLLHDGNSPRELEAYNTDVGWLSMPLPEVVAGCMEAIGLGFRGVKIKVGSSTPGEDLRRVAAVREAIGQDIKLMVDANGRWDLSTAVATASALAPYDLFWLEEPLYFDDLEGHAALAAAVRTPIALGEQLYSRYHFESFMQRGVAKYIQVDALRVAGVTEWLMVADRSGEMGLPVVPHVGDMMQVHQHLAFAHRACDMLEYIPWTQHCFEDPATVRDGLFVLPTQPGAGTTLKAEALRDFGQPLG